MIKRKGAGKILLTAALSGTAVTSAMAQSGSASATSEKVLNFFEKIKKKTSNAISKVKNVVNSPTVATFARRAVSLAAGVCLGRVLSVKATLGIFYKNDRDRWWNTDMSVDEFVRDFTRPDSENIINLGPTAELEHRFDFVGNKTPLIGRSINMRDIFRVRQILYFGIAVGTAYLINKFVGCVFSNNLWGKSKVLNQSEKENRVKSSITNIHSNEGNKPLVQNYFNGNVTSEKFSNNTKTFINEKGENISNIEENKEDDDKLVKSKNDEEMWKELDNVFKKDKEDREKQGRDYFKKMDYLAEEDRKNFPQLYNYPTLEQIDDYQKQQGQENENNNDPFNYEYYNIDSKDDAGYPKFDDENT